MENPLIVLPLPKTQDGFFKPLKLLLLAASHLSPKKHVKLNPPSDNLFDFQQEPLRSKSNVCRSSQQNMDESPHFLRQYLA